VSVFSHVNLCWVGTQHINSGFLQPKGNILR
jgi:hypothetical protein